MTTHLAGQEHTRRRAPATADPRRREGIRTALDVSIKRRPAPESDTLSEVDAVLPQRLRRLLRASLTHWGHPGLVSDAELLLSELVTNALVHTDGPAVSVRVSTQDTHLKIEVNDFSPRDRLPRPAGPDAEHGRGLLIVGALAEEWGVKDDRTTVWCTLPLTEGPTELNSATPILPVLHEAALNLAAGPDAAGTARIQGEELLTLLNWSGRQVEALDVLSVLVQNAVQHGRVPGSVEQRVDVWFRVNEARVLTIDVTDPSREFPDFDQIGRGRLGRGLWVARHLGATITWFPNLHGKTVRATMQPGQVTL